MTIFCLQIHVLSPGAAVVLPASHGVQDMTVSSSGRVVPCGQGTQLPLAVRYSPAGHNTGNRGFTQLIHVLKVLWVR